MRHSESLKPYNYLMNGERFIFSTIKKEISYCKSIDALKILGEKLDVLQSRSINR